LYCVLNPISVKALNDDAFVICRREGPSLGCTGSGFGMGSTWAGVMFSWAAKTCSLAKNSSF
jgi:hypothetical protein